MTWGEFKKQVEDAGVKDDDVLDYIDVSLYDPASWMNVRRNDLGEVIIS